MLYAFGDFVLDSGTRQLLKAGRPVAMASKAFELLELLLRSRPDALSRTRLHAALWPGTHVGRTSLHVLVSQVRQAIGDDAGQERWIRTLHGFGYAFAGPAAERLSEPERTAEGRAGPPLARLLVGDGTIRLEDGGNVLGRAAGLRARIDAQGVSRRHARIVVGADQATIEDLGSKNGTFVGGERVSSPRVLRDGDVIGLGKQVELTFARGDLPTATEG